MTSRPEISIIIPITDRAETLKDAIGYGRVQTIENIEIIIACGNPTAEVLEAAHRAAQEDDRITITQAYCMEMSALGPARHQAIGLAKSDKIMILQDDDYWMPGHAEKFSRLLADADFATDASNSVSRAGMVHRWLDSYSNWAQRRLHPAAMDKNFYEAHYGFRKSAYEKFDVRWDLQPNRRSLRIRDQFVKHAGQVRFASEMSCSSFSFNSPPRGNRAAYMDIKQRAQERRAWLDQTANGQNVQVSFVEALQRHLSPFPPMQGQSLASYLRPLGIEPDMGPFGQPDDAQWAQMETLFSLTQGQAVSPESLAAVIGELVDPGQNEFADGCHVVWSIGNVCPMQDILHATLITEENVTGSPLRLAQIRSLRAVCLLSLGRPDEGWELWKSAVRDAPELSGLAAPVGCCLAKACGEVTALAELLDPWRAGGCPLPAPLRQFAETA